MRSGHVSVIVGASQGIGRAIGRKLAACGGNVVAVGRDKERLASTLTELNDCGPAGDHLAFARDISIPGDMEQLATDCGAHYGGVDLLVVSAGTAGYESAHGRLPPDTRDLPLAAWQRAIDVNLHGAFLANQAFLPMMMARGRGDVVNIGSSTTPHGLRGTPLAPGYSATKFALAAFTRVLAEEVADYGVRVNVVFPGPVEAPLIAGTMLMRPFGGSIAPDNFAEALVDLLSMTEGAMTPDPHILPLPTIQQAGERGGRAQ